MVRPTPRDDQQEVLGALAEVARPIIRQTYRQDSCVGSTRVVIAALKHFGVPAVPVSAALVVFNRAAVERIEREGRMPSGRAEMERWNRECGAHTLGVGSPPRTATEWSGHVVAVAAGRVLVDVAVDQASRPEHGIQFPPALILEVPRAFTTTEQRVSFAFEAFRGYYMGWPANRGYESAPDWTESDVAPVVARQVIIEMDRLLAG